MRKIPIAGAKMLGNTTAKYRLVTVNSWRSNKNSYNSSNSYNLQQLQFTIQLMNVVLSTL